MIFKDSELYDGGLRKDGSLFFLVCLITMLFTLNIKQVSVVEIVLYVAASIGSIIWCATSYKLQLTVEKLVVPLFACVGLLYSIGIAASEEVECSLIVALSDGQLFSRALYLPFYFIFRMFLPTIAATYCSRIVTTLLCALILGFSIQTIPYGETILALTALLPNSVYQMVTGSSVATSLFLSFLFISLTIRVAYTKSYYVMTRRYEFALLFSAGIMVLSDLACLAFLSLLFMIPSRCFGDKKKRYRFIAIIVLFVIVILLYRFYTTSNYNSSVFSKKDVFLNQVISAPFSFFVTLFKTFFEKGGEYLLSFISVKGGIGAVPWPFVFSVIVTYVYTLYFDSGLSPKRFFVIRCTLLSTGLFALVVATKGYLFNSSFSTGIIDYLQGPEFLPLLLPAVFLIKRMFKHPAAPQKNLSLAVLVCVLANLSSVLYYF